MVNFSCSSLTFTLQLGGKGRAKRKLKRKTFSMPCTLFYSFFVRQQQQRWRFRKKGREWRRRRKKKYSDRKSGIVFVLFNFKENLMFVLCASFTEPFFYLHIDPININTKPVKALNVKCFLARFLKAFLDLFELLIFSSRFPFDSIPFHFNVFPSLSEPTLINRTHLIKFNSDLRLVVGKNNNVVWNSEILFKWLFVCLFVWGSKREKDQFTENFREVKIKWMCVPFGRLFV